MLGSEGPFNDIDDETGDEVYESSAQSEEESDAAEQLLCAYEWDGPCCE